MSLVKRIKGDLRMESLQRDDYIPDPINDPNHTHPELHHMLLRTNTLTVDGDFIVTGTTTTVNSEETTIADPVITLNAGEVGFGITAGTAGIDVDRGTADDVSIRYNETTNVWEATDDGTTFYPLAPTLGSFDLVNDLTPQLGGDLDVNGWKITSAANGDVVIDADGSGLVKLDHELSIQEQLIDPPTEVGYTKLYAKLPGSGGTGLYVKNATTQDELVSRKKAIVFGLIF